MQPITINAGLDVEPIVWTGDMPRGPEAMQLDAAIFKFASEANLLPFDPIKSPYLVAAHPDSQAVMQHFFRGWTRDGAPVTAALLERLALDPDTKLEAHAVLVEAWLHCGFFGSALRKGYLKFMTSLSSPQSSDSNPSKSPSTTRQRSPRRKKQGS